MGQLSLLYIPWTKIAFLVLFIAVGSHFAIYIIHDIVTFRKEVKSIITQWAKDQGWRLLKFRQGFGTGPFKEYRNPRRYVFFRFTVADDEGRKRLGWVKIDRTQYSGLEPEIRLVEN